MKKLFKGLFGTILLVVLCLVVVQLSGNGYLIKAFTSTYLRGENSATIGDAVYFDTHVINTGTNTWEWPLANDYNKYSLTDRLTARLGTTESVAFLVIKNDSILHEYYWDGYTDSSRSNSFSMAKSITTMLAQIAIQKGILTGWDQKVTTIFPELTGVYAPELELWHLSTMTSGMQWGEHYTSPFSVTAKAYYGEDISELILGLPIVNKPGQAFHYQSGSTQLLGLALTKVTGKSLAELASAWLWQPMGAKHSATWHIDNFGNELAFCCFNSNARDFARFGKLMSNSGNFNGYQILDSAFTSLAAQPTLADYYGYSFWLDESNGIKYFSQEGILGQYIINIPEKNIVIVRLGHHLLEEEDKLTSDVTIYVEEVLKLVQ